MKFILLINIKMPTFVDNCWHYNIYLQDKCPGGGGALIFLYICRLGLFFRVQNFEFQYFGGFQTNYYFWGYEDFVDIFGGHQKIGLYLGVISIHFRGCS